MENDDVDQLDGVDHRITSGKSTSDFRSSSLEGLSEREVRILVQDEFTPGTMTTSKQVHKQRFPVESNIESGSGLPCTTTQQNPLKAHDGTLAAMAAQVPIAPTIKLTAAEQLIRETKVAAASGDLFMTGNDLFLR